MHINRLRRCEVVGLGMLFFQIRQLSRSSIPAAVHAIVAVTCCSDRAKETEVDKELKMQLPTEIACFPGILSLYQKDLHYVSTAIPEKLRHQLLRSRLTCVLTILALYITGTSSALPAGVRSLDPSHSASPLNPQHPHSPCSCSQSSCSQSPSASVPPHTCTG